MSRSQPSPVFQLFDSILAATTPEIVNVWVTCPGTTYSEVVLANSLASQEFQGSEPLASVSFDAETMNSEVAVAIPVWRANFPADFSQATSYLTESEASLCQSQQALESAMDRIQRLVHCIDSQSGLSFALNSVATGQPQPERELLATLQQMQNPEIPVSFGLGEEIAGFSHQVVEQFQAVVERSLQVIAHYAWIETQVEGRTLARTSVGWLGNANSIWQTGLTAAQVSLHQRTVILALASRDTVLQIFGVTVQTALKLSVLASVPGGLILMLPVAWKFIDQVMTQFREVSP
ncbi:hypothetical protein ACN4EK_05915 [Pantanalinema rosaneae CENA516]|uniref:hypothetical protein n=1 Tax=Pantanalinema rosaneae TaxID=1620701 RepID=UPI003D6F906A